MYMCTVGATLSDLRLPAVYCHSMSYEGAFDARLFLLSKTVCCVCVWRSLGPKGIICIQRDAINFLSVGGLVRDWFVNRYDRVSDALSILLAFGRVCVAHKHSTHSLYSFYATYSLVTYTCIYTQLSFVCSDNAT